MEEMRVNQANIERRHRRKEQEKAEEQKGECGGHLPSTSVTGCTLAAAEESRRYWAEQERRKVEAQQKLDVS